MNELKQLQDIQDEMREGYAPEKTEPDFGEPWKRNTLMQNFTKQTGGKIPSFPVNHISNPKWEEMAILACAGMSDPSDEIAKLRLMQWIPLTHRMPTVDDANEYHDVEWSDGADRWDNQFYTPNMGNRKATHWRRIVLP